MRAFFHPVRTLAAVGVAALALAACGKSSSTKASTATTTPSGATGSTAATKGITISSANVPKVGTVLVNGDGLTLYLLTSEQGGKLTCTDDNGCTKVWPDTELPSGITSATAGTGVDASKLGTITSSSGSLYVTYAGWPLYTFSHDAGPGTANGQGIKSFGGTWETLSPTGNPVLTSASSTSTTNAYGY